MRPTRLVLLLVALMILISAAVIVPLPFFLERPGYALGLAERVRIETPSAGAIDGDFLLTTVYIAQGTIVQLLGASLDDEVRVLPASRILPPGETEQEYFARQQGVFEETAQRAAAVGLRAAGFDVGPDDLGGEGALVIETYADSAATGTLLPGDVIVGAGGQPIETYDDLRVVLEESGPGPLPVTLRRAGRMLDVEVTPRPVPGVSDEPVLGIQVSTLNATVDLPVPVEVESESIGGPSAGLMIALTVFDKVDPVDLADGRRIAGTGTIGFDGEVGPIDGIAQKVLAAHRQDVDLFLAPAEQVDDARTLLPADSDMAVVGVATFDQALDALGGEIAGR